MCEIWKDIDWVELSDKYQISSIGGIRNKTTGYILKPYLCKYGYYSISLRNKMVEIICVEDMVCYIIIQNQYYNLI